MRILATDLGNVKSVACDFANESGKHTFGTCRLAPAALEEMFALRRLVRWSSRHRPTGMDRMAGPRGGADERDRGTVGQFPDVHSRSPLNGPANATPLADGGVNANQVNPDQMTRSCRVGRTSRCRIVRGRRRSMGSAG